MGRGKKSKKKEAGGDLKEENKRTYLKIEATFRCSSDKCNKTWNSVHAWERDEDICCEFCETKAQVENFLDEMCELDNFNCCGVHWQSIHSGNPEECWECGKMVAPQGTQKRFGRHFWFSCPNKQCGTEWEDFSITPQRTQRCSGCKSRGDIIKTRKVKPKPYWLLKKEAQERDKNGGGGGKHNWEYCDMCQDLKGQGKGSLCLNFRKVHCQMVQVSEGLYIEKIVGTSVK